jgi:ADP-ribose pyrophosphatase YjhB (NUDIX family)
MNKDMTAYQLKDSKRFRLKVGVFLLLFQNDKVLLLRRYNTGIADGLYVVPMGGLSERETVTKAIIREAKEEANITLHPENIRVKHVMQRLHHMPDGSSFEQIDVYFTASTFEGEIKNMEPHKCDELKFYPINNLPPSTEKFIIQAIQCVQNGECFSEFGFN